MDSGHVGHVLVVEDDLCIANCLRRLLARRHIRRITHVTTVAEALALLCPPPDWVILDMQLPDGLGLTVLETIRREALPIRVVVSSSTDDPALLRAISLCKPDLVLPKPLNPDLLPIGLENYSLRGLDPLLSAGE